MGLYTSLVSNLVFPLHERLKRHDTVAVRRSMEEAQWWSPERLAAFQLQRLQALLREVGLHVPYYRDLFAKIGFDSDQVRSTTDLQRLPFLTKSVIRANTEALKHTQAQGLARFNTGGQHLSFWVLSQRFLPPIGIVLPKDQAGELKRHTQTFIDRLGLGASEAEISRGHKIRFRRGNERIVDGNVLLAGDAAGLADEFTQEGIYYAIESGRIAARNVLRASAGGGDLASYQAEINAQVMPELKAARLIGFMFHGMLHRAARAWMFASDHTPFLWNAFFAVQRGESTYAREVARVPLLPRIAERMLKDS